MPYQKKLGKGRERHLFVQGVPYPIPDVSMWRGQLQKERVPKPFQTFGGEYILPDLNKALIPKARTESRRSEMKRESYLKRMRRLDRKFLDGKLSQSKYDSARIKLTRQYSDSLAKRKRRG